MPHVFKGKFGVLYLSLLHLTYIFITWLKKEKKKKKKGQATVKIRTEMPPPQQINFVIPTVPLQPLCAAGEFCTG